MKLYKTSHFKKITALEVISFNKNTFKAKGKEYWKGMSTPIPEYFYERVFTRERFGSQLNYHTSIGAAKKFLKGKINDKIAKAESDVIKYTSILADFKKNNEV